MITRKSTYGLRALAGLVRAPSRLHSIAELADSEGIPKPYLTLIFSALRRHGVVEGARGAAGGYSLARNANEISVASVVEILDGPLFPMPCLSPGALACPECPGGEDCAARRVLGAASEAAWKALQGMMVADLAWESPRTFNLPEAPREPAAPDDDARRT